MKIEKLPSANKLETPLLLIVEDKESIRNELARNLRSKGFHTLIAPDGDQALGLIRLYGKMVDAIVTDYNMSKDGSHNADYLLREMAAEKLPMKPTVLYTSEPSNALRSMYDVLAIQTRSEYTDAPEPTAEMQAEVEGDVARLTKYRFSNTETGLTLHVVPKTMNMIKDITGSNGVIAQLVDMGVTLPTHPSQSAQV